MKYLIKLLNIKIKLKRKMTLKKEKLDYLIQYLKEKETTVLLIISGSEVPLNFYSTK